MKLMSRRAVVLLAFLALFLGGVLLFTVEYAQNASAWVKYPANRHLYTNGKLTEAGTIYDRNGVVLAKTVNGKRRYNSDKTVREAVMQTIGDSSGNVSTGVQKIFWQRLNGWNLINGTYSADTGNKLKLTLDADLCKVAYKALNGRKGTVGVYNYKTGEILCMTSSPSFDPENPPNVAANSQKYEGVYLNRLLSGTYTPGSVFKLVTAAAAIDNISDIFSRTFHCTGVLKIGTDKVTCPTAHGKIDFKQALADSCNVTFGQLALELGASTLQEYAEKAGFNSSLSVDGIPTATGKVDLSDAKGANLAWAGIGQYTDTANPLNFMAYVGAIANKGERVTPRILSDSTSGKTRVLSSGTAKKLAKMMRNDVIATYGESNYRGLKLCAKSGTAQVAKGEKSTSWFAGFMDRDDCPLAFVVVIEEGGSGSRNAGPVAAKVLQAAVKSLAGK